MFKVLVGDRSPLLRDVLSLALQNEDSLRVVGEADCPVDTVRLATRHRPDVALVDRAIEPQIGDLVHQLANRLGIRVVVVDADPSSEVARAAAESGASAYVSKTTRLKKVVQAVLSVAEGRPWTDGALPYGTQDAFASSQRNSRLAALSAREVEVLSKVAEGATNEQVATSLSISTETVKSHMANIFAKLNVRNRMAAALTYHRAIEQPR